MGQAYNLNRGWGWSCQHRNGQQRVELHFYFPGEGFEDLKPSFTPKSTPMIGSEQYTEGKCAVNFQNWQTENVGYSWCGCELNPHTCLVFSYTSKFPMPARGSKQDRD